MDKKYKLVSTFDGNDTIEYDVSEGENPETRALEELGWFVVAPETEEEDEEN